MSELKIKTTIECPECGLSCWIKNVYYNQESRQNGTTIYKSGFKHYALCENNHCNEISEKEYAKIPAGSVYSKEFVEYSDYEGLENHYSELSRQYTELERSNIKLEEKLFAAEKELKNAKNQLKSKRCSWGKRIMRLVGF